MSADFLIREFREADADGLRRCVIELQDYERGIDPRLLPGTVMADRYCERIHARCAEACGRVFVAVTANTVVGFVAVLSCEASVELDEPPGTHGLVSELSVLSEYRRQGIGARLLARAEQFAREAGASELRIGVLAGNHDARRLYIAADFGPYLEMLTKRL